MPNKVVFLREKLIQNKTEIASEMKTQHQAGAACCLLDEALPISVSLGRTETKAGQQHSHNISIIQLPRGRGYYMNN